MKADVNTNVGRAPLMRINAAISPPFLGKIMINLLINGHNIFLDDDFYETIKDKKMSVSKNKNIYYLRSGKNYIHRLVIQAKPKEIVDHINGNGLDNRLENLRIASRQMNKVNSKRRTSKYIGVSKNLDGKNRKKPFRVQISENGIKKTIGYFLTEEEAAKAYDLSAIKRFGASAILNF
jgi:hypothetical protein